MGEVADKARSCCLGMVALAIAAVVFGGIFVWAVVVDVQDATGGVAPVSTRER